MFDPDILGWSAAAFLTFAQTVLTPALGFLFLYLMRLPLTKLSFVPESAKYKPPRWVLPLFAHGSVFAIVGALSVYVFSQNLREPDLRSAIKPELYLTREIAASDTPLADVTFTLKTYDGFSNFRVLVNGYHVFATARDCVTNFQCKPKSDKEAIGEAGEFFASTGKGRGSVFDLSRRNPLDTEISLKHFLVAGQNHIDLISENASTGGCELSAELATKPVAQPSRHHLLRIYSRGGPEPLRQRALQQDEHFYAGAQNATDMQVEPYKTSAHERRNVVCERIRIVLPLTEQQAAALSPALDFGAYFKALQADYICATIGKLPDDKLPYRCWVWP